MRVMYFFLLLVVFISCTSRPVEPTRSSRHTIDTLFSQRIIAMQPEIDSLCKDLTKKTFTAAVDSIMKMREIEMEILVE
jgi:hypothetical protein